MNTQLKIAIIQSGKKGYQVAREVGIHDTRLTKIIYGVVEPRESEKQQLATILNKPAHELFPESEAIPA